MIDAVQCGAGPRSRRALILGAQIVAVNGVAATTPTT